MTLLTLCQFTVNYTNLCHKIKAIILYTMVFIYVIIIYNICLISNYNILYIIYV